jgi:ribosomal protein S18 acetylase RimI-like enzyme
MTISTRAMVSEDYDDVVRLWQRSDGVEVAEGDSRREIAAYLARNPALSRVAVGEGRIVGAVLCGHDGRRGLIYHLAVDAEWRGRGVGRRLVEEGVTALKAAGITRVLILVAKDNEPGKRFWAAQGFEGIDGAEPWGKDI